ncbi:glycosyltransferase [Microbacterium azadirachtae]|uniref:Putative glycosyl transferase n=1 Tax=Microbacterium azadirachtae TaxID=582680 RepID=A0A0F0KKU8_9MICO|nr:glycosyltransferase [Microbacterium azadirachtae]KJL21527.1 putative glycosyl transferase [Microbacterium azadirachtae]SDM50937.1 Glycosyl transferase family 2 [Microbacterium azadirachtae]SEG58566.1 Glycosyl transferase family 2 [Microbacterium azadirachtae]SEG63116.1 Glycosyl transferase family 2 [Microbacterium azadirachtae]
MLPWPRSTSALLIAVGAALAALSFVVVLAMPRLPLPGADAAPWSEATAATGGLGGIDLLERFLTSIAGTAAVADGLALAQALVLALPLLWLPVAVARVFRRARAGYALILAPPLLWLLNNGTILIGTQFGLVNDASPLRVPASHGIAGSLVFLTLSLGLLFSTYRMSGWRLTAAVLLLVAATLLTGMFGWLNGVVSATALGVVLARSTPRRLRVRAPFGLLAAVLLAALAVAAHAAVAADPSTPAVVHPSGDVLRGLLATLKQFGAMLIFVIVGLLLAFTRRAPQRRSLVAGVLIASPAVIAGLVYPAVTAPNLYTFTLLSAALGYLVLIALGALAWSITSMPAHVRAIERSRVSGRGPHDLSTASMRPPVGLSVVVPTRNGTDVLEETLDALGRALSADDEVIVVENGSTDGTTDMVRDIQSRWPYSAELILRHSPPGLGEALRVGTLATRGERLLLTADDLPFGFTDLDGFRRLDPSTIVAIGSKAHPESDVVRSRTRTIQSRIFRFLRSALLQSRVGDSQGTLWVDGEWGRSFARVSRESGLMWTTELVLAAEQQRNIVAEVPVALAPRHETGASRFRLGDAWRSFVGFTRLAVYKDDYCNEDWIRSTRPELSAADR